MIFFSHPELHREKVWESIFNQAAERQEAGNTLFATFYMEHKMRRMGDLIEKDYEIVRMEKNEHSVKPIEGTDFEPHSYVLVAKKR